MPRNLCGILTLVISLCLFWGGEASAQSFNASLSGIVKDPSGAAVPGAEVTLRFLATDVSSRVTSGPDGSYTLLNLRPGKYELRVTAKGFGEYIQTDMELVANENTHQNVQLRVGTFHEVMEVRANASPLNTTDAEVKGSITPDVLENLPLIVAGTIRTAANFVVLEPGVSNGSANDPASARMSGGIQGGDEIQVDGISLQEGLWSTSGMWAATDMPMSPDSVREVSVLTSTYDAQYGSSTSGQVVIEHKSGTDQFHGALYEYAKNTRFNAAPFGQSRPVDQEHEFGFSVGGPVWIPKLWPRSKKTFFFLNYEWFRNTGGLEAPVYSVPTMQERQGDFSDWVDSSGNLIPVYDPDTLQTAPICGQSGVVPPCFDKNQDPGPNNLPYLRDQFVGCNGTTPNVICATDPRLVNSLAPGWFQWLPAPNRPGLVNNYVPSVVRPSAWSLNPHWIDMKFDQYIGNRDRIAYSIYWMNSQPNLISDLPPQITAYEYYGDPNRDTFQRVNWDHTFNPNLINHTAIGYQNWNQGGGTVDGADPKYATLVPQIAGVQSHDYPPSITLGGFLTMGSSQGSGRANLENIPEFVVNDVVTWVKGHHTMKFGGEYRWIGAGYHNVWSESGFFNFSNGETGLEGIVTPAPDNTPAGSSIASFLLGQVDGGYAVFRPPQYANFFGRQRAYVLHASDTWKMTSKLSADYGLRWDVFTPAWEKCDNMSFFDPTRPNPDAGNLLGSLVFAGTKWGAASFGKRFPERTWYKGFAPRLGLAYSVTPKTVVRTGYGIFITQMFYQGWGAGVSQDGLVAGPYFGSTEANLKAAFLLQDGFPQNFPHPPVTSLGADNGIGSPSYRPFDSNRRPYSQQWNLTIERQVTSNFYFDVAYVGNKGTRLPSTIAPINVLNPALLSMGSQLYDTFEPTETVVDGVPAPYPDWASQQKAGCGQNTVAQALLPYPQYCGNLSGSNENKGNSTYHSLQIKVENRFSHGLWLLASYTNSKTLTDSDFTQAYQTSSLEGGTGLHGVISPFQQWRNKGLAVDDVPQTLSVAAVYQLPFGKGKRWGAGLPGAVRAIVGGWTVGSVFRATSGVPFWFRSSSCNVPGQFAAACIPAILPGAKPFLQDPGHFDPFKGCSPDEGACAPLFDANAFDNGGDNGYQFALGTGPRVSNFRGAGYHSHDMIFTKDVPLGSEKVKFQLSGQFFNIWNWHTFTSPGAVAWSNQQVVDTTLGDTNFGQWNGYVSLPRYIQLAGRLTF